MGDCGFNPSYGLHALRAQIMVTGKGSKTRGFNPSYGLHALRAGYLRLTATDSYRFNPSYGLHALRA